ncbi:hypothetical protein LCGC14_1063970 [marine sediment metagenome]|uniref:Uncharacterized protein n=1 Tax=marine sediment metagenome TaxID=412755 RepID=A0A0F9MPX4_9ZZZZ
MLAETTWPQVFKIVLAVAIMFGVIISGMWLLFCLRPKRGTKDD